MTQEKRIDALQKRIDALQPEHPAPERKRRTAPDGQIAALLKDIEPFFYLRSVTYVDVGAHRGDVFCEVARSGLRLTEAHLIEPNPTVFTQLERTVHALDPKGRVLCHNFALAERPGRLRLREAGTMTRVIGPAEAAAAEGGEPPSGRWDFEVEATTLDRLVQDFRQPRISILKIDVEGYESQVLAGARDLLASQAIDFVYIEAGLATGGQQTYYREIEDLLGGHGYRLFRIYEQIHEWQTDSPLLRRANLAFLSERFAAENPHRLTRELHETRQARDALEATVADAQTELSRLRDEADALRSELARRRVGAVDQIADLVEETTAERAGRVAAEEKLRRLRGEFARLRDYTQSLEGRHLDLLQSETWRLLEPVRGALRTLRGRKPAKRFRPQLAGKPAKAGDILAPEAAPPKPRATLERVRWLDDRLWGGFSRQALADLGALAAAPGAGARAEAEWSLARWFAADQDFERAYGHLARMRMADPEQAKERRYVLLEADCLLRLGAPERARDLLDRTLAASPDSDDLCLVMANTYRPPGAAGSPETDGIRLGWVNRIYAAAGLAGLRLREPSRPFAFDNLDAEPAAPVAAEGQPKVSVIVPVYAARETLPVALRGLSAQTWNNLEILVVDDASPDGTAEVAEAAARRDPRIRVLRQPVNRGSYVARNAGLRAATGDFVTTHDADDWSHPQKIELQVRHCLATEAVANYSCWIRADRDMFFRGLFRPWRRLVSKSVSSILMPRATIERLGGWVEARAGADTDLMRRLDALCGARSLKAIPFVGPLAISLHEERSLTRQSATHVRTVYHGVRKEFHDAAAHWRRTASRKELRIDPARAPRPFPVPATLLPDREPAAECDVLFVMDLSMEGGAYESTLAYIRAAIAAKMTVAVFHWRRYDLDIHKPLNSQIRNFAQAGKLRIVAAGEEVQTRTVIVGYPVILKHQIDLFPKIDFRDLVVIVNQMASRLRSGGDPQYDPTAVREVLRTLCGTEGIWVPISGLVQRLMRADIRYPAPASSIWTPLIETRTWCASETRWRGGEGGRPVVGRHARDHYTKWPASPKALKAAYCIDRPCSVEIMGGADQAIKVIGSRPDNWTVHRYGEMPSVDFLRRLDVFVHYPHEDYIEEFGRAPMEAMAAGVPVILPPHFEDTFGAAALYAEPEQVWPCIESLWRDEAAWTARVAAGRAFIRQTCGYEVFPCRLAALSAPPSPLKAESAMSPVPASVG